MQKLHQRLVRAPARMLLQQRPAALTACSASSTGQVRPCWLTAACSSLLQLAFTATMHQWPYRRAVRTSLCCALLTHGAEAYCRNIWRHTHMKLSQDTSFAARPYLSKVLERLSVPLRHERGPAADTARHHSICARRHRGLHGQAGGHQFLGRHAGGHQPARQRGSRRPHDAHVCT